MKPFCPMIRAPRKASARSAVVAGVALRQTGCGSHSDVAIALCLRGISFRAVLVLARRGLTHLLEHLVLHPLGAADYHYNGTTGSVVTHFHLSGSVDDITTFLTGVCRSLRELPVHRLDTREGNPGHRVGRPDGCRHRPVAAVALRRAGLRAGCVR
ncbi:hypothetical protein ACFHWS_15535 [Micromonospora sp. LOL_013]|uniref:hypothetical protein n=1 Tax=Micromonospora sp. LOL_013 TaxID=3345414 RepID=UPI003A88C58A